MKYTIKLMYLFSGIIFFSSCASVDMPPSFVKSPNGGEWSSILIRDDLAYDKSFNEVIDIVANGLKWI